MKIVKYACIKIDAKGELTCINGSDKPSSVCLDVYSTLERLKSAILRQNQYGYAYSFLGDGLIELKLEDRHCAYLKIVEITFDIDYLSEKEEEEDNTYA